MTFQPLKNSTFLYCASMENGRMVFKYSVFACPVDDVRSAVEWLKEQMLIRYYQFEEMPDSIIKESHMREIDSINELVDLAFPVFADDINHGGRGEVKDTSKDASQGSPHSHSIPIGRQVTSPHSDVVETGPSASLDSVEKMGAATESVANSEGRQQSMATCCRQQSEGSSPSPSNPHSQKHAARKGWHIPCYTVERGKQWPTCRAYGYGITCDCECHNNKEGEEK